MALTDLDAEALHELYGLPSAPEALRPGFIEDREPYGPDVLVSLDPTDAARLGFDISIHDLAAPALHSTTEGAAFVFSDDRPIPLAADPLDRTPFGITLQAARSVTTRFDTAAAAQQLEAEHQRLLTAELKPGVAEALLRIVSHQAQRALEGENYIFMAPETRARLSALALHANMTA
jgi:hypothetical protein